MVNAGLIVGNSDVGEAVMNGRDVVGKGGGTGNGFTDEGRGGIPRKRTAADAGNSSSRRPGCRSVSAQEKAAPILSVIVPVYNCEPYLVRCLESILSQSVRDMEIICVDDGSTDGSSAVIERYAGKDGRVRVIRRQNRGVSAARNAGLDAAEGRWISFVDGDDEVKPGMYETLLRDCCGEDAVCCGAEEFVLSDGRMRQVNSGYFDVKFSGFRMLEDEDLFRLSMVVWDKLFLREKVERVRLRFPEGLNFEDNAFVFNFFAVNRRVRFVSDRLYRYFRRADSITGQVRSGRQGMAFDYIHLLDSVHDFWTEHGLLPEKQPLFEKFCVYCFRSAADVCQRWERPGIAYAQALLLNRWKRVPGDSLLRALKKGELRLRLGRFPGRDMAMLRPLRGLEKLFFIGNCGERKVICLFSFKIAGWKRPARS